MPHHIIGVGTNDYFQGFDAQFSGDPSEFQPRVSAAIQALESDRSLPELAAERVGEEGAQHLAEDWLRDWWPELQPIEPILRQGLLDTMRLSQETGLPVQAVIVTGLDTFAVTPVVGPNQVTMVVTSPLVPGSAAA